MTGELFFNGKDAYTEWSLSLERGGLEKLMTPAPNKEPVTNKNVVSHGAAYVAGGGLKDSRTLSLGVHIVAATRGEYLAKYASFCRFLDGGVVDISTKYEAGVVYHCHYLSCENFTQWLGGIAKFTLTLLELNPNNRT